MFFRRNSAEKGNWFSWICNPAGVSIRICNPIIEFLFLTFSAKEILTKVVCLFNRIANSQTPCSRIANPAEPRRVSENSMGVLKITP